MLLTGAEGRSEGGGVDHLSTVSRAWVHAPQEQGQLRGGGEWRGVSGGGC